MFGKLIWKNEATLVERRHEIGDVYTFVFRPIRKLDWKPGQYIDFRLGLNLVKHFTIASAPYEGTINVTTRIFEKPSRYKAKLFDLEPGAKVKLSEPQGTLTITDPGQPHLLIAGGIGITPFRAILWDLDHKQAQTQATLLYASSVPKPAFSDDLDDLASRNSNLNIEYFSNNKRITPEDIQNLSKPDTVYLVSGPPAMVEAYIKILHELKIPQSRIRADYFIGYTDKP